MKKKILFGAGIKGQKALDFYGSNYVYCFADNDKTKQGTFADKTLKKIISIEELAKIHADYDVIVCSMEQHHNVISGCLTALDIPHTFFDSFSIDFADSVMKLSNSAKNDKIKTIFNSEEDCANFIKYADLLNDIFKKNLLAAGKCDGKKDIRKKILFGANNIGRIASNFFGNNNVYCFADNDKNAPDTVFEGKAVISVKELAEIYLDYDIVVCDNNAFLTFQYLRQKGIKVCQTAFDRFIPSYPDNLNLYENEIKERYKERLELKSETEKADLIKGNALIIEKNLGADFILEYRENLWYGYKNALQTYAGTQSSDFSLTVVHGESFNKADCTHGMLNSVCFGDNIQSEIYCYNSVCACFKTGAYIKYSAGFYNENEFTEYKKKIGKNLLVFLCHSVFVNNSIKIDVEFNEPDFFNFILEEKKHFDSVTVCVFYTDFFKDYLNLFRNAGFNIVCCGAHHDDSFIKRQRTLIDACDAVLTNEIGTHIPFSLSLGKPVKMFIQDVKRDMSVLGIKESTQNEKDAQLKTILATPDYRITQEQLDAFEPYTGLKEFKTKEEMKAIFDIAEQVMKDSDYHLSKYVRSMYNLWHKVERRDTERDKLWYRLLKDAVSENYEQAVHEYFRVFDA